MEMVHTPHSRRSPGRKSQDARVTGILPYSEGRDGRIYYLRLSEGVVLCDFEPSHWCCEMKAGYRKRYFEGHRSLTGDGKREAELLVQIQPEDLKDFEVVALTSSELMALVKNRPCSRVEGFAIDLRLLSMLKSGVHLC